MRLFPRSAGCQQEWLVACLGMQLLLTIGLLYLYNHTHTSSSTAPAPSSKCVDKSVRYNLHLSSEETAGGKRVIEQAIEAHDIFPVEPTFKPLNPAEGLFDKWRKFKTQMHVVVGSNWTKLSASRNVCLGAQTSLDRLYSLAESLEEWSGPVSISLFAADVEYAAAKVFIDFMQNCFPAVEKQVSFHYTYPHLHPPKFTQELNRLLTEYVQQKLNSNASHEGDKCRHLTSSKFATDLIQFAVNKTYSRSEGKKLTNWRTTLAYPQNLLRNIAKAGCQTEYTIVPDIDMIPNHHQDLMLEDFIQKRQPASCKNETTRCAFVIPVYEIKDDTTKRPSNKSDLIKLVKSNPPLARGFHSKLFALNQQSSDLPRWEKLAVANSTSSDNMLEVSVAYEATYKFRYEPVYVAKATTPAFDERYIGFGMTRNTQAYEMFVAGYQFYVLDNAFASHWGFQSLKSRPKWRAKQQEANNKKFDDFAKEITARYGGKDPYNMMDKLDTLNLKNMHVGYGKNSG